MAGPGASPTPSAWPWGSSAFFPPRGDPSSSRPGWDSAVAGCAARWGEQRRSGHVRPRHGPPGALSAGHCGHRGGHHLPHPLPPSSAATLVILAVLTSRSLRPAEPVPGVAGRRRHPERHAHHPFLAGQRAAGLLVLLAHLVRGVPGARRALLHFLHRACVPSAWTDTGRQAGP